MRTPRIEINLGKIVHNVKTLKKIYGLNDIDVTGVTKVVCGNPIIASTLVKSGIKILADSRIENIIRMHNSGIHAQFLLLRTPLLSQTNSVVRFADISVNSEILVIKSLSKFALEYDSIHKIILMVELGDLREGIMPSDLEETVKQVIKLKNIQLIGLGTNLACYGGVIPDEEKMKHLSTLVGDIEKKFGLKLTTVSGGNSANYNWFKSTKNIGRINNLRIGESIFLGRESLYRKTIPGLYTDAFTLITEIIESKIKPSIPYGKVGQDAFGDVPEFQEDGQIKRALLGIGKQDVLISGLTPKMNIKVIGASSDHIVINTHQHQLEVGNEVAFNLNYGALLSAMNSSYVTKKMI